MRRESQKQQAEQLLALLLQANARLKVEGAKLLVNPPEIAQRFANQIRERKSQLLEILAPEEFNSDAIPRIAENGDLIIPMHTPAEYRYWAGGQSVFTTLAELNAPLEVWVRYAGRSEDLLTEAHAGRCKGEVQQGDGFVFCVECGYYFTK